MSDKPDDSVDAQPIASISSLRSRFENLQASSSAGANRNEPSRPKSPGAAATLATESSRQTKDESGAEVKSATSSTSAGQVNGSSTVMLRSASKGPPPPRPTSKKPIALRDRRRSSEEVVAEDTTSPQPWRIESSSPSSETPTITVKDDDPSVASSLTGVAALRARFDGSGTATSSSGDTARPPGPKSPLEPGTDINADKTSSPESLRHGSVSPLPSRNVSPDRDQATAVIERQHLEIVQHANPTFHRASSSGRATPVRSRATSSASERLPTSGNTATMTPPTTTSPSQTPFDQIDVVADVSSAETVPKLPRLKPAVPPRALPPPVTRTSGDSAASDASLTTPLDSLGADWTAEPEESVQAARKTPNVPPPIPPNRPAAPTSSPLDKPATMPPRLPARQRTVPTGEVVANGAVAPDLPSRPPVRRDTGAVSQPPSRARAMTLSTSSGSSSSLNNLPPPPSRHVTPPAARLAPRPAREPSSSEEDDIALEEGDVPAGVPSAPMITSLKRAMDEYPDSSRANRRPPDFVPRQMTTSTHTIHCFAVSGQRLCVGSHNVKIYDLTLGDAKPVITVELRSTGLDFRGKEPRVTSMSFRSISSEEEEGRYLWCGTSHGHVWELDTVTGEVVDTKAFIHAACVTHIFRHRESMLTLDEHGKLHVFGPFTQAPSIIAAHGSTRAVPWRTMRTSDKLNFAGMIGNQLWTSSGPTTRSTTNSSLRGPTIRVFEPTGEGSTTGKTLFTFEWTGAVTSAAVMPFQPDNVYLGHEGGFVSIFSRKDLICLRVLKISPSDILALEGVGDRIWVGARNGSVSVYDVSTQPWTATNTWNAHPEYPIIKIYADLTSINRAGRYAVWTWARDALHAWDGLLSVDWIESSLLHKEREYCSFRDLRVLICSWNIGSCKPNELSGSPENANFLADCLHSVDSPDIIVFGLQEVIDLDNKKLTAKTVLFGGKNKTDGGKNAADKISSAYRLWHEKLVSAVRLAMPPDCPYVMIHSESLVGLLSVVFVKSEIKPSMKDVALTTVKRGLNGIYGNKGAIVARFVIDDSSVCFINVHLAAGQTQKAARNADLAAILEDKAVFPYSLNNPLAYINGGDGSAILDHESVFLSGDLNYRIDQRRDNVISSVNVEDFEFLLEHDQLRKEMRTNSNFRLKSFKEAPITFAPTYKYTPHSKEYDMSEKKRIPAWCDRVLYRSRDDTRIECLNYKRYEPTVSDHRPISASFRLTIKSIDHDKYLISRQAVEKEWFKKEADWLHQLEAYIAAA